MSYRIKRMKVQVEYEDRTSGWFEIELDPDTRTVLVGLDALGAAGTHEQPESRGLYPIPESEFDGPPPGPSGSRLPLRPRGFAASAEPAAEGSELVPYSLARAETPDVCEYRGGKWYCWPAAT